MLKTPIRILLFAVGLSVISPLRVPAQLVADGATNVIDGISTNIGGTLTIGASGSFTALIITNGGSVTNASGVIGFSATAKSNLVFVTGANSVWNNTNSLSVGEGGAFNRLVVSNGGAVFSGSGNINNSLKSTNNTVIVTGTNSLWACSGAQLNIGNGASFAQLLITGGGTVSNAHCALGNLVLVSSGNVAVVSDPGSLWTNSGRLLIGFHSFTAFNQLWVTNGARVFSSGAFIGSGALLQLGGNSNLVVLSDSGSAWTNSGYSIVGAGGSANSGSFNQLIISNGAVMRNTQGTNRDHYVGNQLCSNNTMLVTGTNSLFSNHEPLAAGFFIGSGGSSNQLLVGNGAVVETDNGFIGSTSASSNNSATISDPGSRWTCTASLLVGSSGSFNQLIISNSAVVATGDLSIGGAVSSGNTLILAGGSIFATNSLIIFNNNVITGNGTINGNVTNSGTLSPGASVGKLVISGNLTLNAGSSNFFEINKSLATNDNIIGLNNVVYGGTLVVTNLSGSLTNGDAFKLFAASNYSGAFTTVILPPLSPGLFWNNKLALDGTIQVIARDPGVDVSHFQGETGISQSSWNQMFTQGKRFAFVKATEGLSVLDATMANNMTRATAAGLRAGVYHFAHPELHSTTNGAVQEADFLLNYAGNFVGPGYLRPVLDLESGSGLSTAALTDWVIAFANEIVANRGPGAAPIIYTLQSFAASELDSRLANYDLWVRVVGSGLNPAFDNPATGVFNNWSFWQYDVGSAGGISSIDLNMCHSEYKSVDSFLIKAVTNPVAPSITSQPQNKTARVGNNATFSVSVSVSSSTPLSYQWRFNDTNISGATANAYTRTNSQLTNAGSYAIVITNAAGSVTSAVATLTVLIPPTPVPTVVLYSENFDSYASPSIVTNPGVTNGFNILFGATAGPFDFSAKFGFDYSGVSSPTTIPSAPHSTNGTTKGLSLTVNKDGTAALTAVNLYPVGQNFTGTFALKFDMWINYPNTGTATEHALFGINHSGNITNRVNQLASDGLFFAVDGDGGVTAGSGALRDFSSFRGGGPGWIPILLSNTASFGPAPLFGANFDSADAGFIGLFPSKSLSFTTTPGTPGNGWVSVEVRQTTNTITWFLNDILIAQYTNTFGYTNGNILIGYNDHFASAGGADNFAVFDNLRVETVPDNDGNGIADDWEMQFFGATGVDADADADSDGMSNLREYYAGTNPTNAASTFRMVSAAKTNNDIQLDWTAVGGHSYVVQISTNGSRSITTNFVDFSPVITVPGTNETTTNYVVSGAATNRAAYYRVRLGP